MKKDRKKVIELRMHKGNVLVAIKELKKIKKNREECFRKIGEILRLILNKETMVENILSWYFIPSLDTNTDFFRENIISKMNFERKISLLRKICKREKFDSEELMESINFLKDTRNKVAHWELENKLNSHPKFLRKGSNGKRENILELSEGLLEEIYLADSKAFEYLEKLHKHWIKNRTY